MCSSMCDMPEPSHFPSSMLPALHHACAETTGALLSSRTMMTSPLSNVVTFVPGGSDGMSAYSVESSDGSEINVPGITLALVSFDVITLRSAQRPVSQVSCRV